MLGPFTTQPFSTDLILSPLQVVRKTPGDKPRLVVDLSFPLENSVNDGISKHHYLDTPITLTYPSVNSLANIIRRKGKGCLMFKTDLSKSFKHIPICPHDYHMCGISWNSKYYVYVKQIFGLRCSALACQRTTNAVTFLLAQQGISSVSYLDDIASAESPQKARLAFLTLSNLLKTLNLIENKDKICQPSTEMIFLGLLLNSNNFTITIPPKKLQDLRAELKKWLYLSRCTRRQLMSIIGKLQHVIPCIAGGRIFLNRMLNTLRSIKTSPQKLF